MAYTHWTGPLVSFGKASSSDSNPDTPNPGLISAYNIALLDTRAPFTYEPGSAASKPFFGFLGGELTLIDQAPSTIATANIAALQAQEAGVPLTLVSVDGAGITVGASVVNALTGVLVTGLLAIDLAMNPVEASNSAQGFSIWNPATAITRAISLTSAGNLSAGTFTVRGYDVYGYPLTATRAGPNANTVNTLKAFKYIASVTPNTTSATTVSIGTADIFGVPLRADAFGYLTIFWDNTLITASTGFVAAVTTDPSTALIGDVRGTYATTTASDGTRALQLFWRPKAANLSQVGLFGVSQI